MKKNSIAKPDKEECERLAISIYQARKNLDRDKRELDSLKNDCRFFNKSVITDEDNIRERIVSTSIILHSNDQVKTKEFLEAIYDELMRNISLIYDNTREDLLDRKEEMEKRIENRLFNTDNKFMDVLNEKVHEHEKMSRSLHSMTQDMTKIKENYNRIIKRTNEYKFSITDYSNKLEEEEKKWKLQILELKKYKILIEKENKKRPITSNTKCSSKRSAVTERKQNDEKIQNYISRLELNFNQEQAKYNKLDSKYKNIFNSRSKMEKRIYDLIYKIQTDTPYYTIEDRNKFIDIICHDKQILSYYNDENFPTVHASNLILN